MKVITFFCLAALTVLPWADPAVAQGGQVQNEELNRAIGKSREAMAAARAQDVRAELRSARQHLLRARQLLQRGASEQAKAEMEAARTILRHVVDHPRGEGQEVLRKIGEALEILERVLASLGFSPCIGQGFIDINEEGKRSIGELTCAGECPDRTRCRPHTNADKSREWCGCPGEEEPKDCHLVKIKLHSGDWAWDCDGPCPQPQDMCTPQSRRAGRNRLVVSCECLTPEGR